MAKFRIQEIADLARQLEFAPTDVRLAQLTAAEQLLLELQPAKAYPFDFLIFRVTGYRPRTGPRELLTGLALQHDLGLLVETVSDSLDLSSETDGQTVLTIDEVCEKFNVTSKTIQRWRRKGLAARRFVFPDGKKRVGFLAASVERFLSAHQGQVARAANFSQVDEAEKQQILRRARRLAGACQCCSNEIVRRIAQRLNRSTLTISHLIRRHDEENPSHAIFATGPQPLTDDQRQLIMRGWRRGVPLKTLARKFCRRRTAIYRVIVEERWERLNRRRVRFIDDPLYHQPDAGAVIDEIASAQDLMAERNADDHRLPRDLPPALQGLCRAPLLTPPQERALFLKLNFHKFQFVTARRRLEGQFVRRRQLDQMEGYRRAAVEVKNRLVAANLRLVVSVARKHLRPSMNLMELVSDGCVVLMRAVDSFDFHKGNRFSTYATLALMKGFARSVPQMANRRVLSDISALADVADGRDRSLELLTRHDQVHQLLSSLEPRERAVIRAHFGLSGDGAATYEQVGARLGLSRQRVRQIEQTALEKLRAKEV
ncbi:MAG TPA: sigma-70 family RNA polymerase sigma factor [Tepidisphaeraceae bacterium]|nr:sigma-70 family RNA polymerase sigma factor [Tepidisphaeraceae bacterium]